MSEAEPECLECEIAYNTLHKRQKKLKRKMKKMQKAFAAIEAAITRKPKRYAEFIIGECEAYRGEFSPEDFNND